MASHAVPSDDAIDQLLRSKNEIQPPAALAANARIGDYHVEYKRSIEHAEEFWADIAGELEWMSPWKKVFQWTYPTFQWFVGAKCNITHNCLDRQVKSGRKNKVAYIWTGEDGSEQQITYGQLLDYVCRVANGLKSLGVKKGDRVIIYMPLGMEGVASMLACARIGAVHSVVYAGFSVQALRSRIEDAQARVIVTADIGYRRGKRIGLRSIVDEAIDGLEIVQKVVVLRRLQPPIELGAAHEVDFQDLIRKQSAHCPPEVMEAEDPLYILYTSGTTGKPKGVVHVHGGYMVGTYYHMTRFWDIRDDDVFFCTSDIGWVVGHSYIVYAPLLAGATTLFREGAIDYPDPAIVWELVEKYRASVIFTAPTAVRMFMRHGDKLPPNKGGLLVLRKPFPHLFRTVYGDPERYAKDWGKIPNAYTTGDVAVCDEDGYFTVVGRADDVLNVAGHRIGTADVEGALVSHPAVAEAAVIGRPDEIKGENIKAFVMLRVGHTGSPELALKLKDHVRYTLGSIAVPADIAFPDKLPKTRSGKIMRRLLKAQELGRDVGDISTLEE